MRFRIGIVSSLIVAGICVLSCEPLLAETTPSVKPLREQLTEEQFVQMGLNRLSPEELARLEAWLAQRDHTEKEKVRVTARAEVVAETNKRAEQQGVRIFDAPTERVFESRIVGTFRGFAGRGMKITLENGQVWQLLDDRIERANLNAPKVHLRQSMMGNHYMTVDGLTSGRVSVVREK